MRQTITASVAIVGAGPVGLSLAIDLASRGVDVVVAEARAAGEPPSVKCNHVASRTMELFRRWGLSPAVRAAGLPDDYPNDVVFRTRATGWELARIHIPCRNERYTDTSGPDGAWPTPEPAHRINQIFLEPLLFEHAARSPGVRLLNLTHAEAFSQDEEGVTVTARNLETGETIQIDSQYLIGCDGGRSQVRRGIGATLIGDEVIQRVQSSYIHAPELLKLIPGRRAWMNYSYNSERPGNVLAIDGTERWLIHNYLLPGEQDFGGVDRDRCIRAILGVGPAFEYKLLAQEDWVGRRLVADRLRDRRVFICGDAAHLWVPYAGYGMNAGIADAANLSWLLAAHLGGWAPAAILDAHERERLPITDQVSHFAMKHALGAIKERNALPAAIEEDSPAGTEARAQVGGAAYELGVQQFACAGLNYGYFYVGSPLIAYDGEAAPGYTMSGYTPSTVPGCRTPHFWLKGGRSLYDALGTGYALLRFDQTVVVTGLVEAAARRGVPFAVIDVQADEIPPAYRHRLVLSRPDVHVAWRGDRQPDNADALIDLIRGAGPASARPTV